MRNTPWLKLACASGLAVAGAAVAIQGLAAPSGWLALDGSIRFQGASTVDWANSGPAGAACPNGGVNVTGSGGLYNCGRLGAPGAPPIAPTLTPAAAADASIISATFIVDPISGDTTACGTGDPTTLNGTNGAPINSYAISTGPVPNKDDLSNVYAVSHTRSDNGHPELYFAAERLVNNGDSHIDFEFLQSQIGRTAACGGTFTGHRTEGDLLVAVDFTNGGGLAGASVWQWHCAPLPNPQPSDGTVCDPGAGALYEQLLPAPVALSVTVNAANIPCGGWICRSSAGVTPTLLTNDFLEGGIDLMGLSFTGCFNTFLPHTRTSAPFTAQLKDFAGPVAFNSCRDPVSNSSPGGTVAAGTAVHDTATLTNGGAPTPIGTVAFFLCQPAQVTGTGCSGGTQVGGPVALVGGTATSASTSATTSPGKYCWRLVFNPAAGSTGVYTTAHTNATTECFTVVAADLPNTGVPWPAGAGGGSLPLGMLFPIPFIALAVAWPRGRGIAVLVVAALVAGSSSVPAPQPQTGIGHMSASVPAVAPAADTPPAISLVKTRESGWRLVIPRIGVDAIIQPVGRDAGGAMAAPPSLSNVGWFNRGPLPGQPGDAVIDGHFGLPPQPAVFRKLQLLRPGDEVEVIWANGRSLDFKVSGLQIVNADSHPAGVFARTGPPRLSLVTCAGAWVQSKGTYSDRLIVTAMLS
jgi:sortase family protein